MIILSKIVRRQCRGMMYGIFGASGSIGAIIGLSLFKALYNSWKPLAMYGAIIFVSGILIIIMLVTRIGKEPYVERPKMLRETYVGVQL